MADGFACDRIPCSGLAASTSAPPISTGAYKLDHLRVDHDSHLASWRGVALLGNAWPCSSCWLRCATSNVARGSNLASRCGPRAYSLSTTSSDRFLSSGNYARRNNSRARCCSPHYGLKPTDTTRQRAHSQLCCNKTDTNLPTPGKSRNRKLEIHLDGNGVNEACGLLPATT
jgi:hypothetical protein